MLFVRIIFLKGHYSYHGTPLARGEPINLRMVWRADSRGFREIPPFPLKERAIYKLIDRNQKRSIAKTRLLVVRRIFGGRPSAFKTVYVI